jgi:uncharacterized protein YndB with AHSA1/START domain/DNA-binding transcriptional ArsR family regulator
MTDQLSRTFAALADPTRRAMLARLSQGEATVGQLAEPFELGFAAISKHLGVLETAGLVSRGRDGQYRPAQLDARPLAAASTWIGDYARFWADSFDTMGSYLDTLQRTITRTFDAPIELVYSMFTTPEHFAFWFGTEGTPVDDVVMDVRVGGAWSAVMRVPEGPTINWAGEYTEVAPFGRLAFTLTDQPDSPAGEPVTVDLVEVDGGTEMTFEQLEMTRQGYTAFFKSMATRLASVA